MDDGTRVALIVNPAAAGGRGLRMLPRIVATLAEIGERHHLHITEAPGEAIEVARRFAVDRLRLVIAVGGDGTVNEVTNGLLGAGSDHECALGIIPAGRGADLARTLKLPHEPADATRFLCGAATRLIDTGEARFHDGSTRSFVNVAGLGFDSMVAYHAARSRLPGDKAPYLQGVASAVLRYRNVTIQVDADGQRFEGRMLAVIVANGQYFGGGFQIVPGAAIDDGRLDLAVIGDISGLELLRQVPRVYRGTHGDHEQFTHVPCGSITVTPEVPLNVQLDGELAGTAPVTFEVRPSSLRIAG